MLTSSRNLAVAIEHGLMDIRQQSAATRLDMATAQTDLTITRADLAAHRLDFAAAGENVSVTRAEVEAARTIAAAKEKKDERNKIISWLSSTDPLSNHHAANKKHLSGTGEWFLKGPSMKIWKLRNSLLWIYGIR
jgi:antitoxin (DNA-binding transcriptional repressor) of toxin-antitoxin stability system